MTREQALHAALREEAIKGPDYAGYERFCVLCAGGWDADDPERHGSGCLAAPAAQPPDTAVDDPYANLPCGKNCVANVSCLAAGECLQATPYAAQQPDEPKRGLCKEHNWWDPIHESPCPRCAAQQPPSANHLAHLDNCTCDQCLFEGMR